MLKIRPRTGGRGGGLDGGKIRVACNGAVTTRGISRRRIAGDTIAHVTLTYCNSAQVVSDAIVINAILDAINLDATISVAVAGIIYDLTVVAPDQNAICAVASAPIVARIASDNAAVVHYLNAILVVCVGNTFINFTAASYIESTLDVVEVKRERKTIARRRAVAEQAVVSKIESIDTIVIRPGSADVKIIS